LLVDLDPQGNATMGCGVDKDALERTICDVLLEGVAVTDVIQPTPYEQLSLLPSSQDLTLAEVELLNQPEREYRLARALQPVADRYDYILMDCPPSLNILTVNALTAADGVLIPMQCEYYAMEGLTALLATIERIRVGVNPKLALFGILRTMFDPRNNLATEVSGQLMQHFGERVFRTVIPRNVRLAEAPSFGKPALYHDKYCRGALAYLALAGEINRRESMPVG
jgi:chromosome partitioning protein